MASLRALKAHRVAALEALSRAEPGQTLEQLASRIADAVVEAEDRTQWVVLVDAGPKNPPFAYGPYGSAETARKAIDSGLMLAGPRGCMLLAMRPVPRKGHTTRKES